MKSLWDRIWNNDIQLEVDYKPLTMPREYDECIMERSVNERVRGHELVAINRVRKHQQAMFVLDIAAANGKSIKAIYLASWEDSYERELGRRRSHFDFGTEHSMKTDWELWNKAINTSTSDNMCLSQCLRDWVAASP